MQPHANSSKAGNAERQIYQSVEEAEKNEWASNAHLHIYNHWAAQALMREGWKRHPAVGLDVWDERGVERTA